MGKYDHIIELTGAEMYPICEGLWNHCSEGVNPNDYEEFASVMPSPAQAGAPTTAEHELIKDWIKEDVQMKAIIGHRLSLIIQNMLREKVTVQQQWQVLHKRFARLNITSQMSCDANDASWYLSVFKNGRCWFVEMGVTFTDEEAVWMLLHGLPDTPQWVVYRSLTMGLYKTPPASASSTAPTIPTKVTFEDITISFSEEANCQSGHLKLVRPGSEYTNAASHSHSQQTLIHKQNPKGIVCDNC
ncbi:hypothetical protein P692DRAFT_20847626 [Suillus brevipes Sb2]|nr:hypothetical protein P692DRAFT_20847626 [Suillus brevipes Sb2]